MKNFLLKLGLFFLPLLLLLAPAFYYLRAAGELSSFDEIVLRNQRDRALIGMAYSNPIHTLKSRIVVDRKPAVIALGTSRSMQLRSIFFDDPSTFYNCGGSVHMIGDLDPFLESLHDSVPALILLSLDQNFFNEAWDDLGGAPIDYNDPGRSPGRSFALTSRELYKDIFRGKVNLRDLHRYSVAGVGLTANLHHEGYRPDGSYHYRQNSPSNRETTDERFQSTVSQIRAGCDDGRFSRADSINPEALAELERFLQNCLARGIHVVAFTPPYAPVVYEELAKMTPHYPHVFELEATLRPIFARFGYHVFDFSTPSSFGGASEEMRDSIHGYETALLRMLIVMSRGDEFLQKYATTAKLSELLERAPEPGLTFPDLED